ncbi:hypothetical protein [Neorhizobium galegae]|uniref:hypothetical protein n=1 Tax=Neorhizobium galegae TaxID=399 RepID=UPI0006229357|nr:hypothetical protein [Neorhizobium galegae]KAB1122038.1 hypothetical protein F4V90_22860 [Neorhizobium galegae]MCQ1810725.1 hypothetical protein [Neorhizobium galegae]CDZ64312.1 Hypothetical protein NGAL_HAMBI2566_59900 [Neorhizobium galegae bv. orientalis]
MKIMFFLLSLGFSLAVTPSVRAEVSIASQNEAATAFQRLDDLPRQTRALGDLPRWSNPEHAKVLGRFWTCA